MSGTDSDVGGAAVDLVELQCPHCGHVIRPRNLEALQSRRYIQCSMCFKRARNPYFVEAQPRPQPQKQGTELQCPKCGYVWTYTGTVRRRVVCPRCFRSFVHPDFTSPEPEGVEVQCRKCGYWWKYTGAKRDALVTVRCPRCNASNPSPIQDDTAVAEKERAQEEGQPGGPGG
jgi:predicted Zn-ribbon and HTH transcriptional regulator